jgi:hypothetical protein
MVFADSPEDLGRAIRSGANEVEITYEVKAAVVRIRAVGPVTWLVVIGAVTVAVVAIIATLPAAGLGLVGTAGTVTGAASAIAVLTGVLGAHAAAFLVKLAVAARDAGAVSELRGDTSSPNGPAATS